MQVIFATILVETSPQALPLGAACVASAVKSAGMPGVKVHLVDISYDEASEKKKEPYLFLAEKIIEKCSDEKEKIVVSFSSYIWNVVDCIHTAEYLKTKNFSDLTLVCGGPEITALFGGQIQKEKNSEIFKKYSVFDYLIIKEGETASVELIKKILNSKQQKEEKKQPWIIHGKTENCEQLSSPWLDKTLDPVTYNGVLWELSRGCPFQCAYCYESKGEKKVRHFPIERLKKELDLFAKKRVPQFFVLDPTFNADKERALKLLKMMSEKLPDAHYQFEIRAEFMDKQLAEAFSNLSCSLQIGLQSANPDVLKKINRTFDRKSFTRKAALMNDYGLIFGFDLIFGLPGDTLPSFKESIDYAVSLYPNHLDIFRLSVLPGTALYEQASQLELKFEAAPPYHIQCTNKFSQADLLKAEHLAFACKAFYSAGRAVPWFLSVLHPLKIRASQFFSDFAEWQFCNNCARNTGFDPDCVPHVQLEKMQLSFLELKYEEKKLSFAFPAVHDVVCLNGAFSRVVGECEESIVDLSYNPEDLLSGEAMDILSFVDEICMEMCRVRVFATDDGPDYEIIS